MKKAIRSRGKIGPKASPRRERARPGGGVQALRPENRRLLAVLEQLATQRDDLGDAWWDEFRATLRKSPIRFGDHKGN